MRFLGLDLGERELRVARGERVLGTTRVTALARVPLDGEAALAAALARLGTPRPHAVLTALPAAWATHRMLVLPFRDRRRLMQTVPLELTGHLPVELDDPVIAFTPLGRVDGGTTVLAAVARRADLAALGAPLAAAGLGPVRTDLAPLPVWNLIPPALGDAALLLADGARSALTLRRGARLAGLRALGASAADPAALAAETRWALAALGGVPPTLVVAGADAGPALDAARAAGLAAVIVPLAAVAALDGFAPDDLAACAVAAGLVVGPGRGTDTGLVLQSAGPATGGSLRPSAALAAAVVLLALLDWGLVRHGLAHRDVALTAAIHADAAAVLPAGRLLAPRAELEAAAAARTRRYAAHGVDAGALAVLRELSTRVPPTLRLDLDELAVEPGGVTLHGRTESFDAVDALRHALAASPLLGEVTADDTRTTVDGRQVEFRLRATRRPAVGAPS